MLALFPITSLKYFKTIHSKFFFSKTSQFFSSKTSQFDKRKRKETPIMFNTDCYEHNLVCNLNLTCVRYFEHKNCSFILSYLLKLWHLNAIEIVCLNHVILAWKKNKVLKILRRIIWNIEIFGNLFSDYFKYRK